MSLPQITIRNVLRSHRVGGYEKEPAPWFSRRSIRYVLVPDDAIKNVVFIGTMVDGIFIPRGTGFIVVIEEHGHQFLNLVTAEHVISRIVDNKWQIWCRANLMDGDAKEFVLPSDGWTFHPDHSTDVAVCPFNPNAYNIDYVSYAVNGQFSISATADVLRAEKIGLGEEIFIVGLFRNHHGTNRNVPIIRVGNISMMKGEPVFTKYVGYTDAYLVEARSIGGLSGSPVFVSMPPFRVVDGVVTTTEGLQYYLLGLMHGHFDIPNLNEDTAIDGDAANGASINTGIGIVIPVEKIIETLNHENLREKRLDVATEYRNRRGATPDEDDLR
jgi:hypothetical protein